MNSKKLFFGTNLKMYKNASETADFLTKLTTLTNDLDISLFVIPSYTSLHKANEVLKGGKIILGAQNISWENSGQFTGEVSPHMIKEAGVSLVMVGHSERRGIFGETDEEENKKILCALQNNFKVLLCIGETLEEKKYGVSDEVLKIQLKKGFQNVSKEYIDKIWVAYEPVWAIGVNGLPATKEYAMEKHKVIKDTLVEIFGEEGRKISTLYGGSVNIENAKELYNMPHIDGLFVGRSAWDAEKFNDLIRDCLK